MGIGLNEVVELEQKAEKIQFDRESLIFELHSNIKQESVTDITNLSLVQKILEQHQGKPIYIIEKKIHYPQIVGKATKDRRPLGKRHNLGTDDAHRIPEIDHIKPAKIQRNIEPGILQEVDFPQAISYMTTYRKSTTKGRVMELKDSKNIPFRGQTEGVECILDAQSKVIYFNPYLTFGNPLHIRGIERKLNLNKRSGENHEKREVLRNLYANKLRGKLRPNQPIQDTITNHYIEKHQSTIMPEITKIFTTSK